MLLRDCTPDDLDRIMEINSAEVPAVGEVGRDAMADLIDQSLIALAAEIDAVVAGFCLVLAPGADYGSTNYAWFSERYDDFVYLDRVAIAHEYRRRGIGRALYAEVERLAARRRPTAVDFTLEVNVRPRNDTSLAFHAALGFVELEQRETPYGARVAMMAKPLTT